MKCPECGFEGVLDNEKFCGECGAFIRTDESKWNAPKWKWGSLISSTMLVFLFWFYIFTGQESNTEFLIGLAVYGFPTITYLLYKERIEKIKYGLAWITFPLITWFFGYNYAFQEFILYNLIYFVIPAIVIDIWYVRKLNEVGK